MKTYKFTFLISIVLLFFGCSGDDNLPPMVDPGGGENEITYRVTFIPNFTATTHPTDYPLGAQFSGVALFVHGSVTNVYTLNQMASLGLKAFAEGGDTSILQNELDTGSDATTPLIQIKSANVDPTQEVFFDVIIPSGKTKISFIAKISPSPDWFVGIDTYELATTPTTYIDEVNLRLRPIDAGTDAGITYNASDSPESELISLIEDVPFTVPPSPATELGVLNIKRTN